MRLVPAFRSAPLLLLAGGVAFAQLSGPPVTPAAARAPAPASTVASARRPAQVAYSHGQLEVDADNSSLNQILLEIVRVTGMKVTGSVADASVFGKYGPGAPAKILDSLLDGTGVNMLLRETASGAPAELILTPQNGPVTPPDPSAAQDVATDSAPAPAVDKPMTVVGPGGVETVVRDINGVPVSAASGLAAPAATPPPIQTPEQRQQQMQQMQQQQQQAMQQRQAGH